MRFSFQADIWRGVVAEKRAKNIAEPTYARPFQHRHSAARAHGGSNSISDSGNSI
jgi:hypothetical protein